MSALSNDLENRLLDHLLGVDEYTAPSALSLALFSGDPGEDGGGNEITGGGYSRATLENSFVNFGLIEDGSVKNTVANKVGISFGETTANWSGVSHWGCYSSATSLNFTAGFVNQSNVITVNDVSGIAVGSTFGWPYSSTLLSASVVNETTKAVILTSNLKKILQFADGALTYSFAAGGNVVRVEGGARFPVGTVINAYLEKTGVLPPVSLRPVYVTAVNGEYHSISESIPEDALEINTAGFGQSYTEGGIYSLSIPLSALSVVGEKIVKGITARFGFGSYGEQVDYAVTHVSDGFVYTSGVYSLPNGIDFIYAPITVPTNLSGIRFGSSQKLMVKGAFARPLEIPANRSVRIKAGGLRVSLNTNSIDGGLTDYAKEKLLAHTFGRFPKFPMPTTLYVQLGDSASNPGGLGLMGDDEIITFDAAENGMSSSYGEATKVTSTKGSVRTFSISNGNDLAYGSISLSGVDPWEGVDVPAGRINLSIE